MVMLTAVRAAVPVHVMPRRRQFGKLYALIDAARAGRPWEELADAWDVPTSTLHSFARAGGDPRTSTVRAVARALGMPPGAVLALYLSDRYGSEEEGLSEELGAALDQMADASAWREIVRFVQRRLGGAEEG